MSDPKQTIAANLAIAQRMFEQEMALKDAMARTTWTEDGPPHESTTAGRIAQSQAEHEARQREAGE